MSGTPTAAVGSATYTVTASNPAGSTTATLSITVNEADLSPAGLVYSTPAPVYAAGLAISPDIPSTSASGGVPTSYSVNPALPGLTLNSTTGIVTGTPAATQSTIIPPHLPRLPTR